MARKWIKAILFLTVGALMLWHGVSVLKEAFTWFGWLCVLLGICMAYGGADRLFCLSDRFERWKV